jgi:phosphomannomutase
LPPFTSVTAQQEPDSTFSTVPFPNPEERGALDLAKECADAHGCNIVLANDPDADRLAVAEKYNGKWVVFTGDEIGTMLGHWLWQTLGKTSEKPVSMCVSAVSSNMLATIAQKEGFLVEETLTGFKWIGSRGAELAKTHTHLFGYEEAIGFCCGNVLFDKDGISALGVFGELALHVYNEGKTLAEHMQSLYDTYGEFVCNNGYYFLENPSIAKSIIDEIPIHSLTSVGPYKVTAVRYLGEPGYDSMQADKLPTLPTDAKSPMLTIRFSNGGVAQFRASGTEPKFKYYIELKGEPGVSREVVEQDLQDMSAILLEELVQPSKHGLQRT